MLWWRINNFVKRFKILANRPECKGIRNYIACNKDKRKTIERSREENCNNNYQGYIYGKKCKRKQNYISYKRLWLISVELKCAEKLFIKPMPSLNQLNYKFENMEKCKAEPIKKQMLVKFLSAFRIPCDRTAKLKKKHPTAKANSCKNC